MSYLCDLFFMFTCIFLIINYIISLKQILVAHFLKYSLFLDDSVDKEGKKFPTAKVQPQGVA